ncbi:hypothetical protein AAVH_15846 [Aphelenchoides avenae]|nr:hypothetical protein AAVH_15846 [Aphelenchus avenae]
MGPEEERQLNLDNPTLPGNNSSSSSTQNTSGNVTLEDIQAIIRQTMAEVGPSKMAAAQPGSHKPVFTHTYIEKQFEQNAVWLQKAKDIEGAQLLDMDHAQELVQDLIKDIEERQAWLELGDKDPSVLKRVDLAKQVDRISSKVSLPKSTIENILKESDAGGKAGPSKKARYSPYSTDRRPGSTQPFRQGGAANEGLA